MRNQAAPNHDDLAADGRWSSTEARTAPTLAPGLPPYEPPAVRVLKTKVVSPGQLEEGYEAVGADGRLERREYLVLGYVVEDTGDADA